MIPRLITSRELRGAKFNTHRIHVGYDMDEVDETVDQAADTLAYYEHRYGLPQQDGEGK